MTASAVVPQHPQIRRKAKIVCTLGPASSSPAVVRELIRSGMDVARLNFSHGTHEEKARLIATIREVAASESRPICILQDLQGPKIRTGRLKYRTPVALKAGSRVTITPKDVSGTNSIISTTFKTLAREVQPGARILLSDGLIELHVRSIQGDDVECEVVNGGILGEHKGINLPGTIVSVPSLTEKDEKDLEFGLAHGVDIVAVSFIRTAADVQAVREKIRQFGGDVWVVAKLEKPQAIEHLEEILEISDSVMVARGDLGVEMPPEKVPIIQKHVIRRAAAWRKPVITATQMLESMIENPRPTRAEASDVANAIFDGSDAVMLSAETASGKYPREAVRMMAKIVEETEGQMAAEPAHRRRSNGKLSISETICESVAHAAQELDMRAISVYTETGTTARLISKYRPKTDIYAFSYVPAVCNRVNLLWGVTPIICDHTPVTDDMVRGAERLLWQRGVVHNGDVIGIVAGTRTASGSTNFLRLHVVGSMDFAMDGTGKERRKASRTSKPVPERRKG
ncbi:MAG: pyruvate kinase [Acidobacteria bacterium]|nr:MAG: pyruvate kinase [Acidobacteriota bacterium]